MQNAKNALSSKQEGGELDLHRPFLSRIWYIAQVVALFREGDVSYEKGVVVHFVFGRRGGWRGGGRGVGNEKYSRAMGGDVSRG